MDLIFIMKKDDYSKWLTLNFIIEVYIIDKIHNIVYIGADMSH